MILIKTKKRLIFLAVVAAALVQSTAAIVSLKGNDKPGITNNPPADDEPSPDAPVTPLDDNAVPTPTDSDDDAADSEPEEPGDDDTGPGDDDTTPSDEGRAHGLARAIEVHERNMEKMTMKGKTVPQGLQMSMDKLVEKNTAKLANEQSGDDDQDKGQHKGNGQAK